MSDSTEKQCLYNIVKRSDLTSETLQEYLSEKAINHHNYRHYSDCDRIQAILDTGYIYLSDGKTWNDIVDRTAFQNNTSGKTNFGICFTYSMSENIAFWMLYSRTNGRMINFTQKVIKSIVTNTSNVSIGQFLDSNFITIKSCNINPTDIFVCDVLYYDSVDNKPNEYRVKHSDEKREYINKSLIDNLQYIKKTMAWSYEKECRLIVQIPNEVINEIIKDSRYLESKPLLVKLQIKEDLLHTLLSRVIESPNTDKDEYLPSCIKNKIDWDVCYNCEYKNNK